MAIQVLIPVDINELVPLGRCMANVSASDPYQVSIVLSDCSYRRHRGSYLQTELSGRALYNQSSLFDTL